MLAQWNIRIYEVPISYHGRTVAEGKKIGWKDAVSAVWTLLKYRFIDDRFTTHDGYYVLQSMRRARGLNRWILEQFRQYLGNRVLEAGCGIGNFTELLLDRERLVCVDNDPLYVEMANWRLGHLENVTTLHVRPGRFRGLRAASEAERIDTIVCLNVLEHIAEDEQVLRAYFDLLAARRPRHHPGSRAPVALQPVRRGARASAPLHERRTAHQTAARRLRGRQHGGVQSPGCGRLVPEQAARAPGSQSEADAGVRVAAAGGEVDGAHEARSGPEPDRRRPQAHGARHGQRSRHVHDMIPVDASGPHCRRALRDHVDRTVRRVGQRRP